jgi:hypothetical protein
LDYESQFPISDEQQLLQIEEELKLQPFSEKEGDFPLQFFLRCSKGAGLVDIYLSAHLHVSIPLRIGDYGRRELSIVASLHDHAK